MGLAIAQIRRSHTSARTQPGERDLENTHSRASEGATGRDQAGRVGQPPSAQHPSFRTHLQFTSVGPYHDLRGPIRQAAASQAKSSLRRAAGASAPDPVYTRACPTTSAGAMARMPCSLRKVQELRKPGWMSGSKPSQPSREFQPGQEVAVPRRRRFRLHGRRRRGRRG